MERAAAGGGSSSSSVVVAALWRTATKNTLSQSRLATRKQEETEEQRSDVNAAKAAPRKRRKRHSTQFKLNSTQPNWTELKWTQRRDGRRAATFDSSKRPADLTTHFIPLKILPYLFPGFSPIFTRNFIIALVILISKNSNDSIKIVMRRLQRLMRKETSVLL